MFDDLDCEIPDEENSYVAKTFEKKMAEERMNTNRGRTLYVFVDSEAELQQARAMYEPLLQAQVPLIVPSENSSRSD